MEYNQLKLENQICFPIYAASRLIIRAYQPLLDKLGLTYPQYIALIILWETDGITVNEIAKKLILNTNTVTPLLKRLESSGLILRERSSADERKVTIKLTEKGKEIRNKAALIPYELVAKIESESFDPEQLIKIKSLLDGLIDRLIKVSGS